jgi:uncharacterized protein
MFVELDRVPPEGQGIDGSFDLEESYTAAEEFRLLSPVVTRGRLEPAPGEEPFSGKKPLPGKNDDVSGGAEGAIRVRGSMSCRIELSCVRCLEPFPLEVAEDLDLLYLPLSANVGSESGQISDKVQNRDAIEDAGESAGRGLAPEELAVSFYRDDRIDLSQMIVEQIVLALPMKPLCRPDCKGLCPHCGVNRNVESCACAPEDIDPRWEALKTLKARKD